MSRDITLGETIYILFTTRQFSTGAPFALAGTPVVSAYENDSVTQITAGITLTASFDSVAGLNLLVIVATAGNGFEAGMDYHLVITTGTVDSVSVVGEVVGEFTIQRSAAKTTADAIETDTQDIQARLPAALVGGRMDSDIGAKTGNVALSAQEKLDVNTEADTALVDYDPPTNAEMVARTIASASYALEATLTSITALVDDLEGRLTAARAGYLDELAAANLPADIDTLLARLTALRAGYIDNLSAGAAALEATLTAMKGATWSGVTDTLEAIRDKETDVETDTQDVQGRLPAALVGGRMDSDVGAKTGNVALSAQEKLDVNTEMDTALNTAIPGVPTADSINQRVAAIDDLTQAAGGGDLAAILGDTSEMQGDLTDGGRLDLLIDQIIADIAALNNISAAEVNAEMLDVLNVDTFAEPTGVPAATVSLVAKLGVLYMMVRNRIDVTASKKTVYGDDDAAEFEKDLTDDGTTYSESEANAI